MQASVPSGSSVDLDMPASRQDPFVLAVESFVVLGDSPDRRNQVARAFFQSDRVRRIVAYQARGQGLDGEQDEMAQEMSLLLFDKVIPGLDSPENVYSRLFDIAKKKGQGLKRSLMSHSTRYSSLDEGATVEGDDHSAEERIFQLDDGDLANADDGFIDRVERGLHRDALFTQVRNRIHNDPVCQQLAGVLDQMEQKVNFPFATGVEDIERPDLSRRESKTVENLPPDSAELAEIRRQLNLSVADFAVQLSVQRGTLTAYLYGRTKSVPDDVLTAARDLLKDRGNLLAQAEASFSGRTMNNIVTGWATQLRLPEAQIAPRLAALLDVSEVTIKRWMDEKTRPSLSALRSYDARVQSTAAAITKFMQTS